MDRRHRPQLTPRRRLPGPRRIHATLERAVARNGPSRRGGLDSGPTSADPHRGASRRSERSSGVLDSALKSAHLHRTLEAADGPLGPPS